MGGYINVCPGQVGVVVVAAAGVDTPNEFWKVNHVLVLHLDRSDAGCVIAVCIPQCLLYEAQPALGITFTFIKHLVPVHCVPTVVFPDHLCLEKLVNIFGIFNTVICKFGDC